MRTPIRTSLLVICFMSSQIFAAEKIDLAKQKHLLFSAQQKSNALSVDNQQYHRNMLRSILNLSETEALALLRKKRDQNNMSYRRFNQLYQGIPVWGHQILVKSSPSGNIIELRGTLISGIETDIPDVALPNDFSPEDALLWIKQEQVRKHSEQFKWYFENEIAETVIFLDNNNRAHLAYRITYFANTDEGHHPTRPIFFIDPYQKSILKTYENLQY